MSAADVLLGRSTAAPAAVARPRVSAPPKMSVDPTEIANMALAEAVFLGSYRNPP